jgi:murein DD-endopeptidase MepM/ murein hydrolase activator NlpD
MSGKVVYVGDYPGWGYSILIEKNGFQVLLSHATDIHYTVGDNVNAGDVVMRSGGGNNDWRDGSSNGPHLHFEIRHCVEGDDSAGEVCQAFDEIPLSGKAIERVVSHEFQHLTLH